MDSSADNIIGLYRRHALAWTQARARQSRLIEAPWLDRFRALMPEVATVLDIGCGSGAPMAQALVERGCDVTGVDSAPEMITLFQQNIPGAPTEIADMRSLKLDRHFGGLLAWDSFFHLSPADQRGMFAVFRDHAAPQAALMFTSGPRHGEAIGRLEGELLYHGSLAPDEYRVLLKANGFEVEAHVAEDPDCGGRTVWLARLG